jgi:excisionase family DNA binding protein
VTELLTLSEVAERLHVSVRTVRREVAAGHLRVLKVGRRPLVTVREFESFVAAARRRAA